MNVYLGGPSAELDQVRADAAELEAAGHVITERWWLRVEEAAALGWATDADVPDWYMRESAERNRRGIIAADLTIVRCRAAGGISSGAAYEIGLSVRYAGPDGVPVRLVGNPRGHVASWDPAVRVVASIAEALR